MKTNSIVKNWAIDRSPTILNEIHQEEINISIYERDCRGMLDEIAQLIELDVSIRASGDLQSILHAVADVVDPLKYSRVFIDIKKLLNLYQDVTQTQSLKLLLATVNTNMCRRFHTDINDIRLLCTYSGPGTLWLPDNNIDRNALASNKGNDQIVIDEEEIQHVPTGAVVLLKGALYPKEGTHAIVHRSPTVEESGSRRLLLRIDNNETANLWQ